MAHVIAAPCIGVKDAACVVACPVDCIHPRPEDPAFSQCGQLYINPTECIDCGMCIDECPVAAIFPEEDLPAEWAHFSRLNAEYFKATIADRTRLG